MLLCMGNPMPPRRLSVRSGLDRIADEYCDLLAGQRVGLVSNASAITRMVVPAADALHSACTLVALLSPEHGIAAHCADGAPISSAVDVYTGLPVYSLYGENKGPTSKMLRGIDVLAFDIQDVGARFYTYIWTMSYVLEAAAEHHVPLIIFDRPNPIGGHMCEGPILESGYQSFVGRYLLPIRHGLTMGELAHLFNSERELGADLAVVEMEGWQRSTWFDDTDLPWVPPSPAMPKLDTAIVYPGMCLFEGTNVSAGRGTATPFECVGAPWIDEYRLAAALNELSLPGVRFRPTRFIPSASNYEGETCRGVYVHVMDREMFRPLYTALHILSTLIRLWPDQFAWLRTSWEGHPPHFDLLIGNGWVRERLDAREPIDDIVARWQGDLAHFCSVRQQYLIYA
jgi:uncharacterized protein YbbC (DUF1343 family)